MGRRNLPGKAALKTAEMPGLGKLWPVWGVLIACVWIAFSPVLSNGFVDWDDPQWILENHSFRGLGWEQIAIRLHDVQGRRLSAARLAGPESHLRVFRPRPAGLSPGQPPLPRRERGPLASSVRPAPGAKDARARGSVLEASLGWLCGIPVVLYAVHPLRVEMVAWASPQAYLPSITFSLLATLAYLRAHPSSGEFRRSWMIGSFDPDRAGRAHERVGCRAAVRVPHPRCVSARATWLGATILARGPEAP